LFIVYFKLDSFVICIPGERIYNYYPNDMNLFLWINLFCFQFFYCYYFSWYYSSRDIIRNIIRQPEEYGRVTERSPRNSKVTSSKPDDGNSRSCYDAQKSLWNTICAHLISQDLDRWHLKKVSSARTGPRAGHCHHHHHHLEFICYFM